MNIKTNYENLLKAKTILDKLTKQCQFDTATQSRLNNVSSRIEITLIDLRIKMEEEN